MSISDCSEVFRQEASELLELLEQTLLDLEQSPDDSDLVDAAFRALHTIKGSGAMFGFERVAGFTHGFETAFDRVRKGLVPPSRELVAAALSARDHIRVLVERPEDADQAREDALLRDLQIAVGAPEPASVTADGVAEAAAGSEAVDDAAADDDVAAVNDDGAAAATTWRVHFRLPRNALVNGANPLLLLDELRELGPCSVVALTEDVPALEEMDAEACYLGWDAVVTTQHPKPAIEEVFLFVIDDDTELVIECLDPSPVAAPAAPSPSRAPDASDASPPAHTPVGDRSATECGEPREGETAGSADPSGSIPTVNDAPASAGKVAASGEPQRRATPFVKRQGEGRRESDKGSTSLRVQAERLDELMDRVGELVIAQARLTQLASSDLDPQIKSVAEEIERLSSGLRDTTMSIRMVPIGSLFGRFRRLVHDLSRDLGKRVELTTVGEETELDKTMIERLTDPLVHLIRNAIDHGLEAPEVREAAGKPAAGSVRLTARHAGAEVLVTIGDDGRGLNVERIREKAEENGLIAPGAALPDSELYQLLFHPGFSTAKEISAVSGRGVGMDVVKKTVEALRGKIDVATTPGASTEVTLRLPLTLAIIDGLLVRVGHGCYAIPLSAVEECVELSTTDDNRSQHRSFLNIRGELVPFLRLREVFDARTDVDPYPKVVIVACGDLRVGLVVDQIIGSHQTVIKSLSKLHADVQTFSGATILGDGTVALILDVAHLVQSGQAREEILKASQREAA